MISRCSICQRHAYSQPSEAPLLSETPSLPWTRAGVNLYEYAGKSYLVACDWHSNFPEIEPLDNTTARTVAEKLSATFLRHGIPIEICSDSGQKFSSRGFNVFSLYVFQHTISCSRFPRSNGLVEKGVQISKRVFKKTTEGGENFWLGVLNYRTTPLEDGRTPGDILKGR